MATTTDISADEQRALDEIRTRLAAKFPDTDSATLESVISDAHSRFSEGKIRDFVPLFVERHAESRLAG